MRLEKIIRSTKKIIKNSILAGTLIISPLMTGCETEEPEHSRNAAEGHAVAYGTWYKPEAGTTSSGWKWHWGYLYLEQNGTNVWGIYRWELYNPRDIKGFVNGNEIHLDLESHNEPNSLDGTINGGVMNLTHTFSLDDGKIYHTSSTYTKQSENIPEEYY